jgi:hypothetical protein
MASPRLRDLSYVPVLLVSWTTPTAVQLERLVPGRDAFEHEPLFGAHLVEVVGGLFAVA